MKTLGGYLKRYYHEELQPHWRSYLLPLLFIVVLTAVEYSIGFEKQLFDTRRGLLWNWLSQWLYLTLIWLLPLWWIARGPTKADKLAALVTLAAHGAIGICLSVDVPRAF